MRFGLFLGPYSRFPTIAAIGDLAAQAEASGFSYVALGEHLITPANLLASMNPTRYDPFVLGAYLAARTRTLRLHFNVVVVPYHHPIRLAKAIATLDQVSEGRLTLTLGSGWLELEFQMLNAPFARRGAYLDQSVALMRRLWTGEAVDFASEFFLIQQGVCQPVPYQKPHPPLWVGGQGKATLRRAVEWAAGWHPVNRTPAELSLDLQTLRDRFAVAGRDFDDFTVATSLDYETVDEDLQRYVMLNTSRPNEAIAGNLDQQRQTIAAYRGAGLGQLLIRIGSTDLPAVHAAVARFGRNLIGFDG